MFVGRPADDEGVAAILAVELRRRHRGDVEETRQIPREIIKHKTRRRMRRRRRGGVDGGGGGEVVGEVVDGGFGGLS